MQIFKAFFFSSQKTKDLFLFHQVDLLVIIFEAPKETYELLGVEWLVPNSSVKPDIGTIEFQCLVLCRRYLWERAGSTSSQILLKKKKKKRPKRRMKLRSAIAVLVASQ